MKTFMKRPARRAATATALLIAMLLAAAPGVHDSARAAGEDAPLQPVVEMIRAEGTPMTAEEFNAVVAPFFEVKKADVGAHEVALRVADSNEGHQLIVRTLPVSGQVDIVMGYATENSITGFLTAPDGKLRDAMKRVRGEDPAFSITEEVRARFQAEQQFWHAWREAVAKEGAKESKGSTSDGEGGKAR